MSLIGENYYLSEMTETHINKDYLSWLNDEEVNKYLEIRFFLQNRDTALKYILSFKNNNEKKLWAIFCKTTNDLIGTVNLTQINFNHKTCMINIMIGDKRHWGKSAASEGLIIAIKFCSDKLKMRKVLASTYAENVSINFTLKQIGFSLEGKLIKNRKLKGNFYSDEFKWGLLLENWNVV